MEASCMQSKDGQDIGQILYEYLGLLYEGVMQLLMTFNIQSYIKELHTKQHVDWLSQINEKKSTWNFESDTILDRNSSYAYSHEFSYSLSWTEQQIKYK